MKLKIQHKHLNNVADFLQNQVSAKGKKNIHRMRIVNVIATKNKLVGEEELALLKEYGKTDDDNELVLNEQGGIQMEDAKEFKKQQEALYDEYFIVEDSNLESALKTVEKLVNEYDKELSGKSAEAHFVLCEAFENEEEKGDEE
ncbi:hypothetical protein H9655_08795 [Cytobacillus sp. Sa5YUA1]|uniref:DUF1617 family protein n=1 Tax=Cytobacillus stercorigallinarum TaxID=2762240 RepID=A0ABR8QNK4_9BACI|nr:hypothetical protein [Cytobacillus stercorigallinarum]MBD7937128.1 hypothetical protein [Cytobacillus stercorigallinarum]